MGWIIPPGQSAEFVCQMEAVLDVYQRPYDPDHPQLCLDESPKQLVSEVRSPLVTAEGVTLEDYEYRREGGCDLYMVCEPLAGRRYVRVRDSHTRLDWAAVLIEIVNTYYPTASKITLVQDNLSAHQVSALYELLPPEQARALIEKLDIVFTPKHGSWLNMAELELSVLARQCTNARIAQKSILVDNVQAWEERRNTEPVKIIWQFTTADARIKLRHLYPSIVS
ncbi:MAG: IS630 family transposase [Anaerolineae bacterium]